ncbi:amino acid adenylation domain-containing protein [Archangium gephyra]|nr:amino acid adenylation domain-containing protein [Archangium gephyra]
MTSHARGLGPPLQLSVRRFNQEGLLQMSDVYDRLASLPPEKRELLLRQLRQKQAGNVKTGIPPRPRDTDTHPLSFAQQRLWLLDQLQPGSAVYNVPVAIRLSGALDVAMLERCFNELLRRHESLRTTLRSEQGQPVQVIAPQAELALETADLRALPTAQHDAEVRRLALEEARKPFDLERGPLLRARLLSLPEQECVLLLTMHHIVSDGWSMGVLVREMGMLYAAFMRGQPSPLMELAVQYVDYASWQREWLQGDVLSTQLGYWREQLAGASWVLELPTDKPRPPRPSLQGASCSRPLPPALSESIKALAQKEGTTSFMVLLAAFQVLLSRYSGQDDICVGSPIAGRNRGELEGLIGFFVNTLVLRTRLSPQQSFRELLAQVKEMMLGAYAHQDVPFEKLVEELKPERDQSRTPLFQVMFAVQNAPMPELNLPGLKMRPVTVESESSKFDMTVAFTERAEGFLAEVEYSTDLYEASTLQRMLEQMQMLLEGIIASPECKPRELPLLSTNEHQQVLVDWNRTHTDFPRQQNIHQLFEERVRLHPESVALEFGETQLSYGELDTRANQLAHLLASKGVRSGDLVGICVERSAGLVLGLLGILKAGAAYVPLDPAYPQQRLTFMLEDTQARAVVAQRHLAQALPLGGRSLICLDEDQQLIGQQPTGQPSLPVDSMQAAYVIYTSGSTGKPKGVCVPHQAVVRLVRNTNFIELKETDRVGQASNASFDAATFEVWGALLNGARLIGVPKEVALDARALGEHLERTCINVLFITPALFNQVARERPQSFSVLRQLLIGGEAADPRWVREVLQKGAPGKLMNAYGPTESTTFATWYHVRQVREGVTTIPIGGGLSNTTLYVLDRNGQPVPIGVPGELHIGGEGLAWGYLHRPELTAEKFVPHPFASQPGERLYRTGDMVRWLPEGNLDFVGRVDSQVKLRGFRIEPGEVESALVGYPGVGEAVVMVREDSPGDRRLVGYVVAREGQGLEVSELKAYLKDKLPDYMVPAALVKLDTLPLNPNGKVDRKALPVPDQVRTSQGYVAPRNETERLLAQLWSEVLAAPRIGIHDNFFELGGHSLLATQALSRIRTAFEAELPLREFFESPTIAALALKLDVSLEASQGIQAPPLTRVSREGPLPLSFAQQRLWFLDQLQPGSSFYNVPTALKLEGALDVPALENSLSALVRRHESLHTTFHSERGQPLQVITPPESPPLQVVDLRSLPTARREAEVRKLTTQEARQPFDLGRGPLLRALLLRVGEHQHVLMITLHHIISDGWSMGVLVRELATFYQAFSQGLPASLPELPLQYADYSAWQHDWLQGEVLEKQLGWWRQQLADAPRALELPTDKPRPPVQTHQGALCHIQLPRPLSLAVKSLAQQEGATPFMVLLATFQLLLSRYSGQDDICVGSPIAGRNRGELEGLIGFFVNPLVLRARLSGVTSFRALLHQVRDTTLGAFEHQDLPFEKLVEELQPQRDLSRSPLFQVMFTLQNAPMPELALPGLTLRSLEEESHFAKFDANLIFAPSEDGFHGAFEYATDLFEHSTAARMMGHFQVLLEAALSRPEAPLSELPLLSEAERQQVLVDWNQTQRYYPRDACIHHLIQQQASLRPGAIAVEFGEQSLSWRELDARSNQLAHLLRSHGVGPDSLVALCLERSLELIVSLLGILKAGGAYLPLDSTYPAQRLAFMLEDAPPRLLLTTQALRPALTLPDSLPCLVWDELELEGLPTSAPDSGVTSRNLAYVNFTSGSTGRPKGVAIEHRAVLRLFHGARFAHFGPETSFLHHSPTSFDATTFEIWGPLLFGGRLVVFPPQSPSDLELLSQVLSRHNVSTLYLSAGLFSLAVDHKLDGLRGLRQLLVGGDVLSAPHARRALEQLRIPLTNGYGPTESTVFSTCLPLTLPEQVGASVSIGAPIANTQVYLLDASFQPVPPGVPGELFIGGEGLARGYTSRPDLTAERFVPNPFASPGERLYRTGDIARWRADGTIDFLGRIDSQVKLRGFRIELPEVEAALLAHPEVREAVAVVREDAPGDKHLVAYVTSDSQQLDISALRSFLKQRLPDFMLPSALVVLEALPLTSTSKVDRKALPPPNVSSAGRTGHFVEPTTPLERQLVSIWSQELGIEDVGVDDHFFEKLGGTSLSVVKVASRMREELGREVQVTWLFEHPPSASWPTAWTRAPPRLRRLASNRRPRQPSAPARRTSPSSACPAASRARAPSRSSGTTCARAWSPSPASLPRRWSRSPVSPKASSNGSTPSSSPRAAC